MKSCFTKFTLLTSLVLAFTVSFAQNGPWASTGIGVLLPPDGLRAPHINFPMAEMDLYASPSQQVKAGKIFRLNSLNLVFEASAAAARIRVSSKDLVEWAPMAFGLRYFREENGFVMVLMHTTGKGLWLSKRDLDYIRYKATGWMEMFRKEPLVLVNQVDVGVNLRKEADASSLRILLVKGNHYGILLGEQTEGLWAQARVLRYPAKPCRQPSANGPAVEEWSGWIKILDDAGYPNVWPAADCRQK